MDKIRLNGFVQRSLEHELNTRNEILIGIGFFRGGSCISPTTTVAILSTEGGVGLHASLNRAQLRPLRVPISALEFSGREDLNPRPPGSSARGSFQFLSH
jgi:hypothetical protein